MESNEGGAALLLVSMLISCLENGVMITAADMEMALIKLRTHPTTSQQRGEIDRALAVVQELKAVRAS